MKLRYRKINILHVYTESIAHSSSYNLEKMFVLADGGARRL